jgi:hypothetical protein
MMSENNDSTAPPDMMAMLKQMRDANMEVWAKAMTDFVNTDSYAGASAEGLNMMLATCEPFQKLMLKNVTQTLEQMNIATRDDVTRLADRFTNIEMRLDDMDAKLDDVLKRVTPQ